MDMYRFLIDLHSVCHFRTKERGCGEASKSEIRRWFERGSVQVNGLRVKGSDQVPEIWESLVLHPASSNRITLW